MSGVAHRSAHSAEQADPMSITYYWWHPGDLLYGWPLVTIGYSHRTMDDSVRKSGDYVYGIWQYKVLHIKMLFQCKLIWEEKW